MHISTTQQRRHSHALRTGRKRLRGPAALLTVAVLAATGLAGVGAAVTLSPTDSAQAAAGSPGTPSDPTTIYTEDFENGQSDGQTPLEDYTGSAPTNSTYTADDAWLEACNGEIIEFNTPYTDLGNCANTNDTGHTRQLAYALGAFAGDATPATNHAVTAYTDGNPGADQTEFATVDPIPLASETGRFVTFSVDTAAVNCTVSAPEYNFSLTSGGTTTPVGGTVNACSSTTTENTPASGPIAAEAVNVGTYTSDGAVLVTGSSIGITMKNANGSGAGNDAAFDNIKIIDETPQLDKSFSPTSVETGGTSTLTFTVTNTSELAAKDGWSFTDALPSGLTVADPATTGGTCDATTTATAGSDSVAVTDGNLAQGETSCTITVQVTADTAGSYTNGPDNVTSTGLNPPADTTVDFSDPSYTVSKKASESVTHPGDKVTYTVTVKNTGQWAYDDSAADPFKQASFTDDLSSVLDDATYDNDASDGAAVDDQTLSWSGDLAVGATKTITYSVTVEKPDTGDQKLDNSVVTPADNGGSCETTDGCTTDTPLQSYTVAKEASTATAAPGGKVTYTVTVVNTGKAAYTADAPASFTDDLSKVTDDATYNNDATDGATVSGTTLTWSGPLAVGETKTVTYSVTVNTPDTGDGKLDNTVVTPTDNGGGCATVGGCATHTTVTTPPAGPSVATGGTTTTQAPVWPWVGTGLLGLAILTAAGVLMARRNRHGIQDGI